MAERYWSPISKLPDIEYKTFVKWVESNRLRLGYIPIPPNNERLFESSLYKAYAQQRGKVTPQITVTGETPVATAPVAPETITPTTPEPTKYGGYGQLEWEWGIPQLEQRKREWEASQAFQERQWAAQQQESAQKEWAARQNVVQQAEWTNQAQKANQMQYERQRMADLTNSGTPQWAMQNELADMWEEWRRVFAQELKGTPRTEALAAKLEMQENPYQKYYPNPAEETQNAKKQLTNVQDFYNEELTKLQTEESNAKDAFNDKAKRVTDNDTMVGADELAMAQRRYETAVQLRQQFEGGSTTKAVIDSLKSTISQRESQWEADKSVVGTEAYWATPRDIGFGAMAVGEPSTPSKPRLPEIPSDVAGFMNKAEWGQPIVTPSPQQWAATPWSTRERVGGYSEVMSGKPWVETLEQMQSMLPQNLRLGKTWQPARQG